MVNGKEGIVKSIRLIVLFLIILVISMFFSERAYSEQPDCNKCHKYVANMKFVHAAIQMGCTSCHSAVDAKDIPHKLTGKIAKGLSSEQPDLCYGCHDKSKYTKKTVHAAIGMGCTGCHNPHSSKNARLLKSEMPGLCYNCHDRTKFEGKTMHSPVAEGMCTACHSPHSSDAPKLLSSEQPALCFTCHDKSKFEGKIVHAPVAGGMCTSCHLPHQGDSDKLLVSAQPDLCYNCHDKGEFTKKNVHAAVMMGCTSCHNPHANEKEFLFEKGINAQCLTCHAEIAKGPHLLGGSAQGHPVEGKKVEIEGKVEVGKDPVRPDREFSCSSCHNPHSSDFVRLFRYKADSAFGLCKYCHKM